MLLTESMGMTEHGLLLSAGKLATDFHVCNNTYLKQSLMVLPARNIG